MCLEASLANRWVVSAAACPLHNVVLPLTGWPQDGRKDSHSQDGEGQGVIKRAGGAFKKYIDMMRFTFQIP